MSQQKLSRRAFLRLSTLAAAGATLAACGPAPTPEKVEVEVTREVEVQVPVEQTVVVQATAIPSEPVEVVFAVDQGGLTDEHREIFSQKYPGYKLTRIDIDVAGFLAMLAANEPIDLFMMVGTYVPAWARKGLLLDLTDYFASSYVLRVGDLIGPGNNLWVWENKRYGMVKDWSPDTSVWINKKLWSDRGVPTPENPTAPVTYEEYRSWAPDLLQKEGDRVLVWGTCFELNPTQLVGICMTLDPPRSLYNEDFSRLMIQDDPELAEVVKFFVDWKKEGTVPSELNPYVSGQWAGQDWVQGAAATVQYGYWFGGMVESEFVSGDDVMLISAPKWGPNYANPCVGGVGAMVVSQTKVADAAWKAYEFWMGEEPAEDRAKSGWGVPGLKSLLPLMPRDRPWRQQAYDQLMWEIEKTGDQVAEFSPYAVSDVIYAAWGKHMQAVLTDEITLDEFLENVVGEVNEAIEEGLNE